MDEMIEVKQETEIRFICFYKDDAGQYCDWFQTIMHSTYEDAIKSAKMMLHEPINPIYKVFKVKLPL